MSSPVPERPSEALGYRGGGWRAGRAVVFAVIAALAAGRADAAGESASGEAAAAAYAHLAAGDDAAAAVCLDRALTAAAAPARRRQLALDLAHTLSRLGRHREAAESFEIALAIATDARTLAALGYARLAAGETAQARAAFERALARAPRDGHLLRQLGYLHKAQGERARAAAYFRRALESSEGAGPRDPLRRERLRREVRHLENRLIGGVSLFWRDDEPASDAPLAVGGRVLSQSQGIAEIALHPGWPALGAGRWIAGFSRLLWTIDGASPLPEDESLQAGVGLKVKPLAGRTLVLALERLIALGAFARNDWLARASFSAGRGFEPPPGATDWPLYHLYLDAAAIGLGDPDLQFNAETRLGWGFEAGPLRAIPHLVAAGFVQDDGLGTDSLIEAGPALSLLLPIGGDASRAPDKTLELRLAYRVKLAGGAHNADGATLTLSFRF